MNKRFIVKWKNNCEKSVLFWSAMTIVAKIFTASFTNNKKVYITDFTNRCTYIFEDYYQRGNKVIRCKDKFMLESKDYK